jgi:hypothetical protein
MADTFRVCFQSMQMEHGDWGKGDDRGMNNEQGMRGGPNPEQFKGFLRSAPAEVQTCLKEKLGDMYEGVASGESMPTPELGQTMKSCFEQFKPQMGSFGENPNGAMMPQGGVMNRIPESVRACVKEKLGDEKAQQLENGKPTGEVEQVMRNCFDQFGATQQGAPAEGHKEFEGERPMMPPSNNAGGMNRMPPEVQSCLKEKLGDDAVAQLGGMLPTPQVQEALRACAQQMGKPGMNPGQTQPTLGHPQREGGFPQTGMRNIPPQALPCLKSALSEDAFQKLSMGAQPSADIEEAIRKCASATGGMMDRTMPAGEMMPEGSNPRMPIDGQVQHFDQQHQFQPPMDAKPFDPRGAPEGETMMPPPDMQKPQSLRHTVSQVLLSAIVLSVPGMWGMFH